MFGQSRKMIAEAKLVPLLLSKRSVTRYPMQSAPPMRHFTVWRFMAYLAFAATAMLGYPTYVLLNLDNVRPFQQARFSEELKQALEERRQLRAEGKLNVLQKKL